MLRLVFFLPLHKMPQWAVFQSEMWDQRTYLCLLDIAIYSKDCVEFLRYPKHGPGCFPMPSSVLDDSDIFILTSFPPQQHDQWKQYSFILTCIVPDYRWDWGFFVYVFEVSAFPVVWFICSFLLSFIILSCLPLIIFGRGSWGGWQW
jgi:hypothetical protein